MPYEDNDRPVILFDGVCNLCNAAVNFVIDRDPEGIFRFGALQSEEARPLLEAHDLSEGYLDSLVLVEGERLYRRSDAALRIARRLDGLWPLLSVGFLIPRPIRDVIYDWIANNRYNWFGKRDQCRIPTPELKNRFLSK